MTVPTKPREPGEPFTGRTTEMRGDCPWLASEDIMGLEPEVEIAGVYHYPAVTFEAGRTEADVFTLAFAGKQRQLVLNATNRKTLVRRFGPDTRAWVGKRIVLWVDERVRFGGKIVCGIRIRE